MADDDTPSDADYEAALARVHGLLWELLPLMSDLVIACYVAHGIMLLVADQHGPAVEEQLHAILKPTKARRKEDTRSFLDMLKREGVVDSYEQGARFIMSAEGDQVRRRLGLPRVMPESLIRKLNPSRAPKKRPDKKG